MIKRTTYEYDIKHTGDEMDRAEVLSLLRLIGGMVNKAGLAGVEFHDSGRNSISVTVTKIDAP